MVDITGHGQAENIMQEGEKQERTLVEASPFATERKLYEISLQQSEEKFRLIAENTNDTIALLDMDFNITYLSPSIMKMRGYTVEEAVLQKPEQILTPASLQKFMEMAAKIMPSELAGTAQTRDCLLYTSDAADE